MTHNKLGIRLAATGAALALLVAGCGDDDDAATDTEVTTTTAGEGGDETTTTAGGDDEGGEFAEYCAVAEQIDAVEDFPPPDLVAQAVEISPEPIAGALAVVGDLFAESGDDFPALLAGFAEDEVEEATDELSAFEEAECGIESDDDEDLPEGVTREVEDDAARVDVVATEYAFEMPAELASGRTSFVLTNDGVEAHFMGIARILEGTLDEALAFEGDPEEAGLVLDVGDSNLAAPGGEDEEIVTLDLEPGNYGMLCFIPAPDGTPHAFLGMAFEFTVS